MELEQRRRGAFPDELGISRYDVRFETQWRGENEQIFS
jgi:hypothetical protein